MLARSIKEKLLSVAIIVCLLTVAMANPHQLSANSSADEFQWFQNAKYGMFIHWGPISIKGLEIGWSRGNVLTKDEYDNLYKQFNPTEFDATKWVRFAKKVGMKYIVFVAKHMDGFCMYDSKVTNYTIMQTPFKRDIAAQIAEECHKAGIGLGFYYCCVDEYYPDWDYSSFKSNEPKPDYDTFRIQQLEELCSNYGRVDILWFDEDSRFSPAGTPEMINTVRKLQPGIIVNDRCFGPQDLETPEKKVGAFNVERLWETCMTIGEQWSYGPDEQLKPAEECIRILVRTVGKGGNLLLNVGPMPNGRLDPSQKKLMSKIGKWLDRFGQSIYDTRGGPFRPDIWGVSTYTDNKIYLHILRWPADGTIELPQIQRRIVGVKSLTSQKVGVKQFEDKIVIKAKNFTADKIDNIVVLTLDGYAAKASPAPRRPRSLSAFKKIKTSVDDEVISSHPAKFVVDDNTDTYWTPGHEFRNAWIELDLGMECKFDEAFINEGPWVGTSSFELQIKKEGKWETVHYGQSIGQDCSVKIAPMTARFVRLNLLKTNRWIAIYDFSLYSPGKGWIAAE